MIIPTIALSSALAFRRIQPAQPVVTAATVPVQHPQEPLERPERTEPPHGEGSGESPMYGGMGAYGTLTVTHTANVNVSLGGSGIPAHTHIAWLPNRFPLIVSSTEFVVAERLDPPPQFQATIQVHPKTTKHMGNPSTKQIQRAVTRRQR